MKRLYLTSFLIVLSISSFLPTAKAEHEGADIRILESKRVFSDLNLDPEAMIRQDWLRDADTVIIFPRLYKAGFFYGARFGLGVILARDADTGEWSPPAFIRASGGSFGYQLGVESTEVVLIGRQGFNPKSFKGGPSAAGTASMAAGPWGLHSEWGTGWQAGNKLHWHTRSTGFFAGVAIDGNVFSYDTNAIEAYYGRGVTPDDILFNRKANPTATGKMLMDEITRHEGREPPQFRIGKPAYLEQPRNYEPVRNYIQQPRPQLTYRPQYGNMQTQVETAPAPQPGERLYFSDDNAGAPYRRYYDAQRQEYYIMKNPEYFRQTQK